MIIVNNSHPEKSLYIIGSHIINSLKSEIEKSTIELYELTKHKVPDLSIHYFQLSLDWLYIAEIIELNQSGDIKLCN